MSRNGDLDEMHRSNSIDVFPSPMGRGAAAARSVCFAAALLLGLLAAAAPAQATRSRGGGVLHIGVSNSGGRVWDVPAGSGSTRHLFVSTGSPTVLGYSCANPLDCPTGRRHRGGWLWWLSEIDGIPPEISAPDDILVEQQNLDGTPLSFDDARLKPLVNDNRDPNPDVLVQVPGLIELTPLEQLSGGRLLEEVGTVTFPLGRTQVIYVAVDENGNRSLPDRTWVTVVDTSPPTLEVVEELVVEAEG
ncbi:MAG: hypothetical protein FJ125_18365, partial [Deltaproteobacteria bacterium]|nr:hypothetical protein [Deltaproteobacteria bacterium]